MFPDVGLKNRHKNFLHNMHLGFHLMLFTIFVKVTRIDRLSYSNVCLKVIGQTIFL